MNSQLKVNHQSKQDIQVSGDFASWIDLKLWYKVLNFDTEFFSPSVIYLLYIEFKPITVSDMCRKSTVQFNLEQSLGK